MKFQITLPGGLALTPKAYLGALKTAIANQNAKFKHSFRDPTGWMGGGYTGEQIVAEHWTMVADKYIAQLPPVGKGNAAKKKMAVIADKNAECKWSGQKTGTAAKRFCDAQCANAYHGY